MPGYLAVQFHFFFLIDYQKQSSHVRIPLYFLFDAFVYPEKIHFYTKYLDNSLYEYPHLLVN